MNPVHPSPKGLDGVGVTDDSNNTRSSSIGPLWRRCCRCSNPRWQVECAKIAGLFTQAIVLLMPERLHGESGPMNIVWACWLGLAGLGGAADRLLSVALQFRACAVCFFLARPLSHISRSLPRNTCKPRCLLCRRWRTTFAERPIGRTPGCSVTTVLSGVAACFWSNSPPRPRFVLALLWNAATWGPDKYSATQIVELGKDACCICARIGCRWGGYLRSCFSPAHRFVTDRTPFFPNWKGAQWLSRARK